MNKYNKATNRDQKMRLTICLVRKPIFFFRIFAATHSALNIFYVPVFLNILFSWKAPKKAFLFSKTPTYIKGPVLLNIGLCDLLV